MKLEGRDVYFFCGKCGKHMMKLSGWPAQICQHECDHLQGIII